MFDQHKALMKIEILATAQFKALPTHTCYLHLQLPSGTLHPSRPPYPSDKLPVTARIINEQRPRCVESKGLQLTDCTPVDLGDSGEDGEDCLGLDVEKQRRRATAAIQALEAAAKEADEGARVENEALNGCKQSINDSTRRLIAKACPSPAGPPPPELVRKSRRGHGVPPVG